MVGATKERLFPGVARSAGKRREAAAREACFELTAILTFFEQGLGNCDRLHADPVRMKVQDHTRVLPHALDRGVEQARGTATVRKNLRHTGARFRLIAADRLPDVPPGRLLRVRETHLTDVLFYCNPPRTDVMISLLNPSQCMRPT